MDFVIYSSLMVACLIPLYIYREKFFSAKYENNDNFNVFLKDLKFYMQKHHPKIHIEYSIVDKTKNELNLTIRETLIIENIVNQFFTHEYQIKTQKGIPREKYWISYEEKSKSNPKYPNDWQIRKEFAWKRDDKSCNRCGNPLNLNDAHTLFVKDIKDSGGYNLENILILCVDCNRILNSQDQKHLLSSLVVGDKLMTLIK
jgi:hypothetical protein